MCFSNATLFYGLWVTTASLDFAATAHKATRPTFLAIDLIVSRRRSGKLEIEGQDEKTTARDLPEEVWELVKHELVETEVARAEKARIDRFRCDICYEIAYEEAEQRSEWDLEDGNLSQGADPVVKQRWTRWGMPECEHGGCYGHIGDSGILRDRTIEQIEDINALLKHYHLQLATEHLWAKDGEESYWDFDSLMAISLPLQTTELRSPSLHVESCQDYGSSSDSVHFARDALHVSADVDRRFRRLVSTYRLQVGERGSTSPHQNGTSLSSSPSTVPSTTTTATITQAGNSSSSKNAEVNSKALRRVATVEPRWTLWSVAESCM